MSQQIAPIYILFEIYIFYLYIYIYIYSWFHLSAHVIWSCVRFKALGSEATVWPLNIAIPKSIDTGIGFLLKLLQHYIYIYIYIYVCAFSPYIKKSFERTCHLMLQSTRGAARHKGCSWQPFWLENIYIRRGCPDLSIVDARVLRWQQLQRRKRPGCQGLESRNLLWVTQATVGAGSPASLVVAGWPAPPMAPKRASVAQWHVLKGTRFQGCCEAQGLQSTRDVLQSTGGVHGVCCKAPACSFLIWQVQFQLAPCSISWSQPKLGGPFMSHEIEPNEVFQVYMYIYIYIDLYIVWVHMSSDPAKHTGCCKAHRTQGAAKHKGCCKARGTWHSYIYINMYKYT